VTGANLITQNQTSASTPVLAAQIQILIQTPTQTANVPPPIAAVQPASAPATPIVVPNPVVPTQPIPPPAVQPVTVPTPPVIAPVPANPVQPIPPPAPLPAPQPPLIQIMPFVNLPVQGEHTAPSFDDTRPKELERYFNELQAQLA